MEEASFDSLAPPAASGCAKPSDPRSSIVSTSDDLVLGTARFAVEDDHKGTTVPDDSSASCADGKEHFELHSRP